MSRAMMARGRGAAPWWWRASRPGTRPPAAGGTEQAPGAPWRRSGSRRPGAPRTPSGTSSCTPERTTRCSSSSRPRPIHPLSRFSVTTPRLVPRAGTALTTTRTAARYLKRVRRHWGSSAVLHYVQQARQAALPKRSLGMTRTDQLGPRPVVTPASKRRTASSQRVMVLTIADQGASSVSNFALALIVAHYSSASALGVFAILTSTYVLSQGLVRSLSSDCLLTRSETDDGLRSNYERGGYLAAIVLSVSVAVLIAAVSGLLPHEFTLPFVIFAVSFPLMACQDFARFIGISRYDPAYAIWLDLAWLVLFLVAYVVLKEEGLTSLSWLFGAWSGAGALVGLWTLRAHLARSRRRQLLRFWDESERGVGLRFAGQFMLVTSWTYFVSYLLLFVLPLASIGVLQAVPARPGAHHGAAGRGAVGPHRIGDQALPGRHAQGRPLPPLRRRGLVRRHDGLDRARLRRAHPSHGEPVRPQLVAGAGDRALRRSGGGVHQFRQRRHLRRTGHAGGQREPPALGRHGAVPVLLLHRRRRALRHTGRGRRTGHRRGHLLRAELVAARQDGTRLRPRSQRRSSRMSLRRSPSRDLDRNANADGDVSDRRRRPARGARPAHRRESRDAPAPQRRRGRRRR